ncbi:MAG: helix-turn-helix domain-containing protein [Treponema sp.]|jgi:transcriptional regulator with XRE-family HTH domain|nr:helix-turn-helix domain-containing protein [Treponema sp.]
MAGTLPDYDIRSIFSGNLRFYRKKNKLSQMALSIRAGLAHNFVNDIEKGKKWVSPETIGKLGIVLGIEPYRFFLLNPSDGRRTKRLHVYLDELYEHFNTALGDIKESYLGEKP